MKPTKEQIGKLLVWCGFEYRFVDTWLYPDGSYGSIPDIDSLEFLGFLFKYVVPKLPIGSSINLELRGFLLEGIVERCIVTILPSGIEEANQDPVLALFGALDKIREEE